MSLLVEQIERSTVIAKSRFKKWIKNQRNRKIRRVKKTEIPNIKYKGWLD